MATSWIRTAPVGRPAVTDAINGALIVTVQARDEVGAIGAAIFAAAIKAMHPVDFAVSHYYAPFSHSRK